MEENHWLLQHKMWQPSYIPYQHHHLLRQCCATQWEGILRAGMKCCQSNLDQTQVSGLNISCKSVLLLKIWKSRFWSALASALLQRTVCTAWKLGWQVPEKLAVVDYSTRVRESPRFLTSPTGLRFSTPRSINRKQGYNCNWVFFPLSPPHS